MIRSFAISCIFGLLILVYVRCVAVLRRLKLHPSRTTVLQLSANSSTSCQNSVTTAAQPTSGPFTSHNADRCTLLETRIHDTAGHVKPRFKASSRGVYLHVRSEASIMDFVRERHLLYRKLKPPAIEVKGKAVGRLEHVKA